MSDSTQGNDSPKEPQSDDTAPKYVTVDSFNAQLNAAITARLKATEKKVEESVSTMFTGFTSKLEESLNAKFEAFKPKEAPKAEPKSSSVQDAPEFKSLQAQLQALTQANQRIENERKAERAKARELTLRTSVANALTASGIPAPLAKKAVFELVDGTKRIAFQSDDSDSLTFRSDDGEALDLESGLKSWLSSDDAKFYKPASGAAGSGDRAGNGKAQPKSAEAKTLDIISQHFGLGQ